MLLSASLNAFLIGLGIYLGYVWTRNLDEAAGQKASRAVFITYVVGLGACYGIYAPSGAVVADENDQDEETVMKEFLKELRTRLHTAMADSSSTDFDTHGAAATSVHDRSQTAEVFPLTEVTCTEPTQQNSGSDGADIR